MARGSSVSVRELAASSSFRFLHGSYQITDLTISRQIPDMVHADSTAVDYSDGFVSHSTSCHDADKAEQLGAGPAKESLGVAHINLAARSRQNISNRKAINSTSSCSATSQLNRKNR